MMADTLSDTLMKMKLKSLVAGAFDTKGRIAVQQPSYEGFKLYVVLKGERWVSIEGSRKKYHIQAGDCFLMTGGKPFVIASDPDIKKPVRLEDLSNSKRNGMTTINGGGESFSIGTAFNFEGHLPKIIFGQLPDIIHIPAHLDQAAVLRWTLDRFVSEFRGREAGRSLILNHLAPIMLLQILRIYLSSSSIGHSLLFALSDPKLARAIDMMHSDYAENRSLDDFAKVAGMSRSGFAFNFKKKVGITPMDYLLNWRMQMACELLRREDSNTLEVAHAVGYESASAFSAAFKKVVKCRPGAYQKSLYALMS